MSGEVRREEVELAWQGGLRFDARVGAHRLVIDSDHQAGPSPTQALAVSLAGCMAIDVADILQKGRFPLDGLEVRLVSERRGDPPRYVTRVTFHFVVKGRVPPDRVERAIELSRERYCSVLHSLRPDLAFHASFEIA
jgi:putative redox protein